MAGDRCSNSELSLSAFGLCHHDYGCQRVSFDHFKVQRRGKGFSGNQEELKKKLDLRDIFFITFFS